MLYEYSFILYIKTDNIYKDVAEGFKTKFDQVVTQNVFLLKGCYQTEKIKKELN